VKQKPTKELAFKLSDLSLKNRRGCCKRGKKVNLISDLSAQVQAGSKFAIVSDGSNGKSSVLNTLIGKRSAFKVAGILKKQQGRKPAVYTSQSDLLLGDLTLEQNLWYFIRLGSVNRRLVIWTL
jgi:ABC-type multidrug transport system ATPase subunit